MLRSIKDLHGYTICATDGNLGNVYALLFDDRTWFIRYLVVDTGSWLPGRRVLLAPITLGQPSYETQQLPVALTQEQVKNSPDINTDQPVSRQQQLSLHRYYGWPIDAGNLGVVSSAPAPLPPPAMVLDEIADDGDPHLRSTREVIGYYIEARDRSIGHVEDFIVDEEAWAIRYMVVDTRNWWPGKKVLISPMWIRKVSWANSEVHVDLPRKEIKESPAFNPEFPVNREYEELLYNYYGRPTYWQRQGRTVDA